MKFKLLFLFVYLVSVDVSFAQRFVSDALRQSAELLQLQNLKELPSGYSVINSNDISLSIIKKGDRIDHIGRPLFSKEFREEIKLPIYDFLEFAWLEQSLIKTENPFKYKNVFFNEGNWADFSIIKADTPCSITINDGKNYSVKWILSANKLIDVTFPVDYENIISTATRGELEQRFIEDLLCYKHIEKREKKDVKDLAKGVNEQIFVIEGDNYLTPDINCNTFYVVNENDDMKLVFDTLFLKESLFNIFCSQEFADSTINAHILFNLHDSKLDTLTVPAPVLTSYLRSEECKIYFGIEGYQHDNLSGTVIAYNSAGGYNHVFKVKCNSHDLSHISMTASLYVPTTNIRELHKQYIPKKEIEKIKWK